MPAPNAPIKPSSGCAKPQPVLPPRLVPASISSTVSLENAESEPSRQSKPSSTSTTRPAEMERCSPFRHRSSSQPPASKANGSKYLPSPNQRRAAPRIRSRIRPRVKPNTASSSIKPSANSSTPIKSQPMLDGSNQDFLSGFGAGDSASGVDCFRPLRAGEVLFLVSVAFVCVGLTI